MTAFSAYDEWKLDGGWPYGDTSAQEREEEEAWWESLADTERPSDSHSPCRDSQ